MAELFTLICKECGKAFQSSSSRTKYCTDLHYRPCPICGDPVEAKYLSDPPRKCEKCKHVKAGGAIKPKSRIAYGSSEPESNIRIYKGESLLGFIPGHAYQLEIGKSFYTYEVYATRDITEDKVVDLMIPLSSQISIDATFEPVPKSITHEAKASELVKTSLID